MALHPASGGAIQSRKWFPLRRPAWCCRAEILAACFGGAAPPLGGPWTSELTHLGQEASGEAWEGREWAPDVPCPRRACPVGEDAGCQGNVGSAESAERNLCA